MTTNLIKKILWIAFYSLPLIAFLANVANPHGEIAKPQTTWAPSSGVNSPPVKVIINLRHRSRFQDLLTRSSSNAKLQNFGTTAQRVSAYVRTQAMEHGVNPKVALWIVKHESQFNPRAKGDGEASRGLWQISKIYHPEVSDKVAFNVASSTEWSLERIRAGKVNEWSTYRFCRTLYQDCPF